MDFYHRTSFHVHAFFSFCQMMITYLEVMNLYNCERYSCVFLPSSILLVTVVNAVLYRRNAELYAPIIVAHLFGITGLGYWVEKYVQTFPDERAEFYDTHAAYFCMMFVANLMSLYRYIDQPTLMRLSREEIIGARNALEQNLRSVQADVALQSCTVVP